MDIQAWHGVLYYPQRVRIDPAYRQRYYAPAEDPTLSHS
jgi:hypothetical protein